jgi:AcrR family transcriptional regulator
MEVDTRTRLIEVAERLWSERGVNGVSLREIGAAAGQRNTGAARYHFGSKEGLVNAVFEHRMVPVNEQREAMLAELDATADPNDLRGLAEAFLYPLSEQLGEPGRPSWYLRFSMQAAFVDGAAPTDLAAQPWTSGVLELRERFLAAMADLGLPPALRRDRWDLFTGHMAGALATRERHVEELPRKQLTDRALFLAGLVDTAVALAAAPVSAETARLVRRTA